VSVSVSVSMSVGVCVHCRKEKAFLERAVCVLCVRVTVARRNVE
jgi:hypothetical protein